MKSRFRPYLIRLVIVFGVSLVFILLFTEVAYAIQKESYDRPPETFRLIIPEGTAEKVDAGEDPIQLPEGKVFVIGDVLEVINQDIVDHQLGPVWVPPGATGKLVLEVPDKYSFSCSFTPSQYLGFDVREATTIATRIIGLSISVPTTTAFLYLYSFLVFPLDKEKKQKKKAVPAGENA